MNRTHEDQKNLQPIRLPPRQEPNAVADEAGRSSVEELAVFEGKDDQGKSQIDYQSLRPGDERAYEALAQAVLTNVEWLLILFQSPREKMLLKIGSLRAFSADLVDRSDQFAERCCEDCAKIMRQIAIIPEVRGTSTVALAKEIRKDVFEPVDKWLSAARDMLEKVDEKEKDIRSGGYSPDTPTRFQSFAQALGSKIIVAGLNEVSHQPERLFDYALAKCLGSQVSLERQQRAWSGIQGAITRGLDAAISLTQGLPVAGARIVSPKKPRRKPRLQDSEAEAEPPPPATEGRKMTEAEWRKHYQAVALERAVKKAAKEEANFEEAIKRADLEIAKIQAEPQATLVDQQMATVDIQDVLKDLGHEDDPRISALTELVTKRADYLDKLEAEALEDSPDLEPVELAPLPSLATIPRAVSPEPFAWGKNPGVDLCAAGVITSVLITVFASGESRDMLSGLAFGAFFGGLLIVPGVILFVSRAIKRAKKPPTSAPAVQTPPPTASP